jgi:hypothetical protein
VTRHGHRPHVRVDLVDDDERHAPNTPAVGHQRTPSTWPMLCRTMRWPPRMTSPATGRSEVVGRVAVEGDGWPRLVSYLRIDLVFVERLEEIGDGEEQVEDDRSDAHPNRSHRDTPVLGNIELRLPEDDPARREENR